MKTPTKEKQKKTKTEMPEWYKKYLACEKAGHRWYDIDELYEKCHICNHARVQKDKGASILHIKKKKEGEESNVEINNKKG